VTPAIWVDAEGRRRPTYPCPRSGREAPRDRYPLSTLDHLHWQMFTMVAIVNW